MENDKITIGFHYVDECRNEFKNESSVEVFYSLGDTTLSVIGTCMNNFLRQVGFYRHNDNILMEDLTDEEYDAVVDFLTQYREEHTETVCGGNTDED